MNPIEPVEVNQDTLWDWIVIGTGIGGSTFGHFLAKSGRRVLFIEKGIDHRTNKQKKAGHFIESIVPSVEKRTARDYQNGGRAFLKIWDATRERLVKPILGSGTGGSSALYGMVMERFWQKDFTSDQWPVSFEEMQPHYQAAEGLFGVSSAGPDPLRNDQEFNYTTRPSLKAEGADLMATLALKGLHPYTLPLARKWGTSCQFCQSYLCEHSCKNDAAKVCLAPALDHMGAALLAEAEVVEIMATGSHVTGVKVLVNGEIRIIQARQVALAAGALLTPLLLLKSRSADWPMGLANRSGMVGRNLMRHYIDLVGLPSFSIREKGDTKEIGLNDFYHWDGEKLGTLADFGHLPPVPVILEDLDNDMAAVGNLFFWIWKRVRPIAGWILNQLFKRTRFLALIIEDHPDADNQVEEGTHGADLTIHYTIRPQELTRIHRARSIVKRALGPLFPYLLPNAENTKLLAHACGTCRMGEDPRKSVVNRFNRAHGIDNLYIVDSSFFPTSGGANPALTIAANAHRVAQHITQTQADRGDRPPSVLFYSEKKTPPSLPKKRVLFMPASSSLAHVGRLVRLAQALDPETYDVTFACDKSDHRFVPSCFQRREASSLSPDEFRRRLEKGIPLIDAPFLKIQVEEDLRLLREGHAELVVGDFRPSLSISAPLAHIPYMNVVNALWSPWNRESFQVPALPDSAPLKWLGSRWGRPLTDTLLIPLFFNLHSRAFNKVRREGGLPPLPNDLRHVYTAGDFTAYPDLATLFPTPGAPSTHRHIGPILWKPDLPLPEWWSKIPSDKPLVYLTAGSTGQTRSFEKTVEALLDFPVVVAVATAERATVQRVPGRVFVADYLPGDEVSRRATLVINNGGSGGVYQALAAGVPVLGIAANMDQCMVMKSVVHAGAGMLVMERETKGYDWKKVLSHLLSSQQFKKAATRLSHSMARTSGPNVFACWIEQILHVPPKSQHSNRSLSLGAFREFESLPGSDDQKEKRADEIESHKKGNPPHEDQDTRS